MVGGTEGDVVPIESEFRGSNAACTRGVGRGAVSGVCRVGGRPLLYSGLQYHARGAARYTELSQLVSIDIIT
jgi:hypothetical protein